MPLTLKCYVSPNLSNIFQIWPSQLDLLLWLWDCTYISLLRWRYFWFLNNQNWCNPLLFLLLSYRHHNININDISLLHGRSSFPNDYRLFIFSSPFFQIIVTYDGKHWANKIIVNFFILPCIIMIWFCNFCENQVA